MNIKGFNRTDKVLLGLLTIILAVLLGLRLAGPVKVQGSSMEPTIHDGQFLLVDRTFEPEVDITRGTVVIARMSEEKTVIKRVVALPGDTVEVAFGRLYINGITEEVGDDRVPRPYSVPQVQLGQGEYFILGDNYSCSRDSHNYGPIDQSQIIALVLPFLY